MESENFITIDREKAILKHTPMSRYGNANELVGAVIYLASDAASFVTGTELCGRWRFLLHDHINISTLLIQFKEEGYSGLRENSNKFFVFRAKKHSKSPLDRQPAKALFKLELVG